MGDNKKLEDRVLALTTEAKGLETHLVNAEDSVSSRDGEIARLQAVQAIDEKEQEKATVDKEKIQQKAFDDVYNMHKAYFNHFLQHVPLISTKTYIMGS